MKYTSFIVVALVVGVMYGSVTHSALANEADITPQTRSVSEIAKQYEQIQAQLLKIKQLLSASVIASDARFIIKVDETTVVDKPMSIMTRIAAQKQCEAVAYSTTNMWQLVTCQYGTEVIYRDVFIAG